VDARGLYEHRFDAGERAAKARVWAVLCAHFFQRYIAPSDTVLDLGAGFCEFINHIACARKFAVDGQPQVTESAAADVEAHCGAVDQLDWCTNAALDVVFVSNLFEHLPDKTALLRTLREIHRVLKPGGRLLILQPNIRYAFREYWDFLDHQLPLSDWSMLEGLALTGFTVTEMRSRFLPYSTKSTLPQWPILIRLFLAVRPAQWLLGKQMFVAARRA
jgi:SAM-dependent methyltransferase